MTKYKNKYRTTSARLKDWDYSSAWWYYVTINTKDHKEFFGEIVDGKMKLNSLGLICEDIWKSIPQHYKLVELDYHVIMPNHVHGIIILNPVETGHAPSLPKSTNTLSNIVGSFKSAVTKSIRENGHKIFAWQPRFYDRIIRNEKELFRIRKYIEQNPLRWGIDKEKNENICDDLL